MKPYLIGIAGPSCAGKSYLSAHLCCHLKATVLQLDSYYFDLSHLSLEQRAHSNFDAPQSIDSELLIEHVRTLSRGEPIDKPIYDFRTHSRTGLSEHVSPGEYIIIEGLFALYWEEVRAVQSTKVFVDLGEETCLARRVERDMRERGRTRESVIDQFRTTVRPMAERYLHPTRKYADLVLTGDTDIDSEMELVLSHIRRQDRYPHSCSI
jgi:uridine kinase